MGGNLKTTEFLKDCLADALVRLLKAKSIEKITIPELAKEAGVGRTTYFRNFKTKNEVLAFRIVRLWEKWAEEHSLEERRRYTVDNALDFFSFNYGIRDLLGLIYTRGLQSALYNAFYQVMMPQYGANSSECYTSRFYCYGLFGLLDEWVQRGFYESPEEMAGILRDISGMPSKR